MINKETTRASASTGSFAVRAVIFDMDGVLVDSEWFIAEAARRMFLELYALKVTHEDFKPFVGHGEDRFIGGVAEKYGLSAFDGPAAKKRTYAIYEEIATGQLKELPGAAVYITACRKAGLKTAVATSADEIKLRVNLRELGFADGAFDALVNGSELKRKKPFPDIFLEAARRLKVPPESCWVVEDAVGGVQAAKAAGMRCLGLSGSFTGDELMAAGADALAANLALAASSSAGPIAF